MIMFVLFALLVWVCSGSDAYGHGWDDGFEAGLDEGRHGEDAEGEL